MRQKIIYRNLCFVGINLTPLVSECYARPLWQLLPDCKHSLLTFWTLTYNLTFVAIIQLINVTKYFKFIQIKLTLTIWKYLNYLIFN